MSARLTVLFFILLCLEAGIVLTLLPWVHPFGLSDWGDNFFLLYAARRAGLQGLQHAVSSGWMRGLVTGLGLLNIMIAVWESLHFRQTVRMLQGDKGRHAPQQFAAPSTRPLAQQHESPTNTGAAAHLSDYRRSDEAQHHRDER